MCCRGALSRGDTQYLKNLRQDGCCEEGGVLDHNIVAFILVGDIQFIQKVVSRLPNHHGTEQLTSQPCTAPWCYTLLNEGYLRINSQLSKFQILFWQNKTQPSI